MSNLLQACTFAEQDCCKLKLLSGLHLYWRGNGTYSQFVNEDRQYVILTDSFSVLKALKASNRHSKRVINLLAHQISVVIEKIISIEFVWTPRHSRINENELVDSLASAAPGTKLLSWISHEDLSYNSKKFYEQEFNKIWLIFKYCTKFSHLSTIKHEHRILPPNRMTNVLLSRFKTDTSQIAHKFAASLILT
ncbi:hypothetical protein AVEN_209429-1 [Araneus ventricosus]|uniref:Uncharacterized protein n=1 Tax=Araneus ventricosus TaxID=182803 RepID=A0A4Y2LG77_ARAVE|nr:hypothetical protein AVEN_209429-1 [Araneus ventricosus]